MLGKSGLLVHLLKSSVGCHRADSHAFVDDSAEAEAEASLGTDGLAVGFFVGSAVVGFKLGRIVGWLVGRLVGSLVGRLVGIAVGSVVGEGVGSSVDRPNETPYARHASVFHDFLQHSV
jgi:hypothetical protein